MFSTLPKTRFVVVTYTGQHVNPLVICTYIYHCSSKGQAIRAFLADHPNLHHSVRYDACELTGNPIDTEEEIKNFISLLNTPDQ